MADFAGNRATVLLVEDDVGDQEIMRRAFQRNEINADLRIVQDGEEAMDYLRHQGNYADPASAPRPNLILLDLNMPRKDGPTVLAEIKADPILKLIPVVVFTTSGAKADILHTYGLGASGYVKKPATFSGLVHAIRTLHNYWAELVESPLPSGPKPNTLG